MGDYHIDPHHRPHRPLFRLGERACALAMAGSIPVRIKQLLREARPYAEGRGIRFPVKNERDVPMIAQLVEIKCTPK